MLRSQEEITSWIDNNKYNNPLHTLLDKMEKNGLFSVIGIDLIEFKKLFDNFLANGAAYINYNPRPYHGSATLFYATQSLKEAEYSIDDWQSYIVGKFEIYPVTGNHYSILQASNINTLANRIKLSLQKATNPNIAKILY